MSKRFKYSVTIRILRNAKIGTLKPYSIAGRWLTAYYILSIQNNCSVTPSNAGVVLQINIIGMFSS